MATLGIYQFIHNAEEFDYPVKESIRSAALVADQIVICECESTDNTEQILQELKAEFPDKITIVRHPWVKHYTELAGIGNYAATFLRTDWKWQIQSDEVIHQDQVNYIKKVLDNAFQDKYVTALTTKYHHFLANYETEFPFCYQEIARIYKSGSKWRLAGDACNLDFGNQDTLAETDIEVYHYGKVHQGAQGYKKEISFQALYTDIGFPDPKLKQMLDEFGEGFCDYVFLFESAIKEKKFWKFKGTHPAVMQDRINKFKAGGWEQFQSRMKGDLSIK